ncbi:hypothetical protein ARHIZOSPH14_17670 [Agromyces rhizosphaerae]|uniref:Uncharacterized protein n=1 Tax=Agromyces rhizosphaerae TaxID=88374 RepID=A0A9W6FPJ8_9MICO|nr:hypothetical protein ARHIZOSPH14_17670 [Agromyces rhizosphaerae]
MLPPRMFRAETVLQPSYSPECQSGVGGHQYSTYMARVDRRDRLSTSTELIAECEAQMWRAAAEVAAARAARDEAERRLQLARDAVGPMIQRYGSALDLNNQHVSRETVRALYWDHPDIRARDISDAFAIEGGAAAVHRHSGSSEVVVWCVGGCDTEIRIRSRTSWSDICEPCMARRTQERREAHEAWQAQHRAAREADKDRDRVWIREQLSAGRTPEEVSRSWEPDETSSLARAIFRETLLEELARWIPSRHVREDVGG